MLLKETFLKDGHFCLAVLDDKGLYITSEIQATQYIPLPCIVSAWSCPKGLLKCCPTRPSDSSSGKESTTLLQNQTNSYSSTESQRYPESSSGEDSFQYSDISRSDDSISTTSSTIQIVNSTDAKPESKSTGQNKSTVPFNSICNHISRVKSKQYHGLTIEFCDSSNSSGCGSCLGSNRNLVKWHSTVHVLLHESGDVIEEWKNSIWSLLKGVTSRPTNLHVILNPVGGKKKAVPMYLRKVAPILARARIHTSVHKTTHAGHATELATTIISSLRLKQTQNWRREEGIVVVGGDGIILETVNGVLEYSDQHGIEVSDIRIAPFAGGSTNAYVHSVHGTQCLVHAALHVVMGSERLVDVAAIYSEDKFQLVAVGAVCFGFAGRSQETASQLRHLGPIRDVLASIKEAFLNKHCRCVIETSEGVRLTEELLYPCEADCPVCEGGPKEALDREVRHMDVIATMVLGTTIDSYDFKNGVIPSAHLSDGFLDAMILKHTSTPKLLSNLFKLLQTDLLASEPTCELVRAKNFHFHGFDSPVPFNCDGELRYFSDVKIITERQKLRLFGTGKQFSTI